MPKIDYHQPFLLPPNRTWRTYLGGQMLDRIEGKETPADTHFPEDWIGSATRAVNPGREHLTDEGIGRAKTAAGLEYSMEKFFSVSPAEALGAEHVKKYGGDSQLLVKFLDSSIRLHVQAHPSVPWAEENLGVSNGKTEAWWFLEAGVDNPSVILGFQHPPVPEEWKRIVAEQDTEAMMACFEPVPVEAGDVLIVEGGVLHAVGKGILMIEVMEPTDYVVRCEYALGGFQLPESARTMGLGLDKVIDMFDYTAYSVDEVKKRYGPRKRIVAQSQNGMEEMLLGAPQTDRFEVRRLETGGAHQLALDGRFSILIVVSGEGDVTADGRSVHVSKYEKVLLPAALEEVELDGQLQAARCLPPLP